MQLKTPIVQLCADAVEVNGLFGLLKTLNSTTIYRFTGIYHFDGKWVKSVWLYDREHPNVEFGSDVLWDHSYCRMTAADGEFCEIVDAIADPRLVSHAARARVQSYVAVLLRKADRSAFGTLCHYDVCPRETPREAVTGLQAARDIVEQALSQELTERV